MTGTTGEEESVTEHQRRAAMEPRADDGDDKHLWAIRRGAGSAAMEPRADDGDDAPAAVTAGP